MDEDLDMPVPEDAFFEALEACSAVEGFMPMYCWEDGDHTPDEGPEYDPTSEQYVPPTHVWPNIAILYLAENEDDPEPLDCAVFHSEWHCGALPVLPLRGLGDIGDSNDQWAIDAQGNAWCAGMEEHLPYMSPCTLEELYDELQDYPEVCRVIHTLVSPLGHWGGPTSN